MKCQKCGGELNLVKDYHNVWYVCEKCSDYFDAEYMKARAEKAESELKAIKARIEALEPSIISKIMTEYLNWRDLSFATVESEHKCCEEILEILIKQIGGVK